MSSDPFGLRELSYSELARALGPDEANRDRHDAAWMEWFERLRMLALQRAGEPAVADDIASTIMARMLEQRNDPQGVLARIRQAEQPEAYVRIIVRNETYRFLERESHASHESLPPTLESSAEQASDDAIFRELRDALTHRYSHLMEVGLLSGELTKADFELLRLWAQGTSTRQMARDLRTSEFAVRKRIERAKRRYRRVFSRDISQVFGKKDFADCLANALERAADGIPDR